MNPELTDELKKAKLPQRWETIVNRLYALKKRWPCGAQSGFGGQAKMRMEVAFRTWEDHFTVWKGDQVTHTFTLNFDGTISKP